MAILSETEYLDALNAALQSDPDYEEGMKFVAHPDESNPAVASGYAWRGPDAKYGAFARVGAKLAKEHVVRVTPRQAGGPIIVGG